MHQKHGIGSLPHPGQRQSGALGKGTARLHRPQGQPSQERSRSQSQRQTRAKFHCQRQRTEYGQQCEPACGPRTARGPVGGHAQTVRAEKINPPDIQRRMEIEEPQRRRAQAQHAHLPPRQCRTRRSPDAPSQCQPQHRHGEQLEINGHVPHPRRERRLPQHILKHERVGQQLGQMRGLGYAGIIQPGPHQRGRSHSGQQRRRIGHSQTHKAPPDLRRSAFETREARGRQTRRPPPPRRSAPPCARSHTTRPSAPARRAEPCPTAVRRPRGGARR